MGFFPLAIHVTNSWTPHETFLYSHHTPTIDHVNLHFAQVHTCECVCVLHRCERVCIQYKSINS